MDPYSPTARFVAVTFRTGHLFTMAVFVGGVWLGAPADDLGPWRSMAIGTGLLLLVTELSHDPQGWLWQACGLAVVAHVAALGLLAVNGRLATALAVVVGAVGSHAPKWLRKWSLRDGPYRRDRDRDEVGRRVS